MKYQNILSRRKVTSQRVTVSQSTNIIMKNVWFKNPFSFAGKNSIHTQLSSYCIICGKIGGYFKSGKYSKEIESLQKQRQEEDKHFRVISISGEELYEKYHDKLPVFFVEDIFKEKHVDLGQNNNLKRE